MDTESLRQTWDAIGTAGQAALCGAIAGPLLSWAQALWTRLKLPGVWQNSSTRRKRLVSILLAGIPAGLAAARTGDWQPVVLAGLVAWGVGQGAHKVRKRRTQRVTAADAPEDAA